MPPLPPTSPPPPPALPLPPQEGQRSRIGKRYWRCTGRAEGRDGSTTLGGRIMVLTSGTGMGCRWMTRGGFPRLTSQETTSEVIHDISVLVSFVIHRACKIMSDTPGVIHDTLGVVPVVI